MYWWVNFCHYFSLLNSLYINSFFKDVGSGSGYLTACFARYLDGHDEEHDGKVIGIEHQPELVKLGIENINEDDPELIKSGRVTLIQGDGRLGCPEHAPYDAIHVGAAGLSQNISSFIAIFLLTFVVFFGKAPETPHELINQLKPGGRLIVPVGPEGGSQYLEQFDKNENGEVSNTRLMGVMYVPLTDLKNTWLKTLLKTLICVVLLLFIVARFYIFFFA